jgi:hypothetical protein
MKSLVNFTVFLLFTYALSAQDAVVAAEKMNVLYIGVDNPLSIAVPNDSDDNVTVSMENGDIRKIEKGHYIATVSRPGVAKIIVKGGNTTTVKGFRIKAIPDPVAVVTGLRGQSSELGKIKVAGGLFAEIVGFDFDAKCSIQSYDVIIVVKGGEVYQIKVKGSAFTPEVISKLDKIKAGDIVNFMNIKTRCPGDQVSRDLNSLNFTIK